MKPLSVTLWRYYVPKILGTLIATLIFIAINLNLNVEAQVAGSLTTTTASSTSFNTVVNSTATEIAYVNIQLNTEDELYVADYQQIDSPQMTINVSRDSYVYVFSIDSNLHYAQVLPNSYEINNYIYAAQGASFPSYEGNYSFSLEGMQGFTTLFALASPRALSEIRLERYVQKYLLFAEAYSDPAKLANVIIGPGVGSDISYVRVSGNQAMQGAYNTVPLNPSYYQLDYSSESTQASAGHIQSTGSYNVADYGSEYTTGAYLTAEYGEVLNSYQESLDIYNTYTDEPSSVVVEPVVSQQVTTEGSSQDYDIRQTITLNGVEGNVTTGSSPQTQIAVTPVAPVTSVPVQNAPITNTIAIPPVVVEQSLQSAVNITPFENWVALNLHNYRFVFQQYCYCADDYLYEMVVSVENGKVNSVQYAANNEDVPQYVFDSVPSIEDIFMGIAETRVEGFTTVNVAYDQNFSFPNSTYFVNNPETETDDVRYEISYLEMQ